MPHRLRSPSIRSSILALTLGAAATCFACAIALAQQTPQQQPAQSPESGVPVIESSKFQAVGAVNANAVFVRSGPSENDYPVMKLDKGAQVTVVGARFEWLKIVPPDGSFCYVAKAYVEK